MRDAFSGAWLGAGTVHSRDRQHMQIMRSAFALCSQYQQLTVVMNHFDDPVPAHAPRGRHSLVPQFEKSAGHNRVGWTWIPGMKVLFWKLVLTPAYVQRFSAVWMFDSDVAVHPSIFPLGSLMGRAQWHRRKFAATVDSRSSARHIPWLPARQACPHVLPGHNGQVCGAHDPHLQNGGVGGCT